MKIEKGADKEKVAEELMKEIEDLESELDKKDEIKKEGIKCICGAVSSKRK